MKRIKNIQQLNQEKQRIRIRRLELEHDIQRNWGELKESVSPVKVVQRAINKFFGTTEGGENNSSFERIIQNPLVKQGLNIALSLLIERVVKKVMKRKPKSIIDE